MHLRMQAGSYTQEQLAALNIIFETAKCLESGRSLDRHFNPVQGENKYQLVKCEWLASGNLVLRDEKATKHYQHAESTEEAMKRRGVFTTMLDIFNNLPKRRKKPHVSVKELKLDNSINERSPTQQ